MTETGFKNLKVGDKVRIVKNKQGNRWNDEGKMDKWLGKVMTVCDINQRYALLEEAEGWCWFPEMIECVVGGNPTVTEHLIRGNKVIVKLSNGRVGVARCNPEDKFDIYEGTKLAIERAYGKEEKAVKEVERVAKIGEYIKVVDRWFSYGEYNNGDVLKVIGLHNDSQGKIIGVKAKGIGIYLRNSEYVVLENYKPVKKIK